MSDRRNTPDPEAPDSGDDPDAPPTEEELRLIRTQLDPEGVYTS